MIPENPVFGRGRRGVFQAAALSMAAYAAFLAYGAGLGRFADRVIREARLRGVDLRFNSSSLTPWLTLTARDWSIAPIHRGALAIEARGESLTVRPSFTALLGGKLMPGSVGFTGAEVSAVDGGGADFHLWEGRCRARFSAPRLDFDCRQRISVNRPSDPILVNYLSGKTSLKGSIPWPARDALSIESGEFQSYDNTHKTRFSGELRREEGSLSLDSMFNNFNLHALGAAFSLYGRVRSKVSFGPGPEAFSATSDADESALIYFPPGSPSMYEQDPLPLLLKSERTPMKLDVRAVRTPDAVEALMKIVLGGKPWPGESGIKLRWRRSFLTAYSDQAASLPLPVRAGRRWRLVGTP